VAEAAPVAPRPLLPLVVVEVDREWNLAGSSKGSKGSKGFKDPVRADIVACDVYLASLVSAGHLWQALKSATHHELAELPKLEEREMHESHTRWAAKVFGAGAFPLDEPFFPALALKKSNGDPFPAMMVVAAATGKLDDLALHGAAPAPAPASAPAPVLPEVLEAPAEAPAVPAVPAAVPAVPAAVPAVPAAVPAVPVVHAAALEAVPAAVPAAEWPPSPPRIRRVPTSALHALLGSSSEPTEPLTELAVEPAEGAGGPVHAGVKRDRDGYRGGDRDGYRDGAMRDTCGRLSPAFGPSEAPSEPLGALQSSQSAHPVKRARGASASVAGFVAGSAASAKGEKAWQGEARGHDDILSVKACSHCGDGEKAMAACIFHFPGGCRNLVCASCWLGGKAIVDAVRGNLPACSLHLKS
jgi:hypothetical protein